MLRAYRREDCRLVPTELDLTPHSTPADAAGALWLDLITPTREEVHFAEHLLGISIPTQEEAQEIEVSARLYHEDGAEFMTMTGVSQLESEAPMTTPISFILKGETLATIRYAQPKPFFTYATRAQKTGAVPCISSEQVMLGLVEALIERMAEALEKTGRNLERLSRQVFRYKAPEDRELPNQAMRLARAHHSIRPEIKGFILFVWRAMPLDSLCADPVRTPPLLETKSWSGSSRTIS